MTQPVFDFPNFDLSIFIGEDFFFAYDQVDADGNPVDLAGASAEVFFRKSELGEKLFCQVKGTAITGGTAGQSEFVEGASGGSAGYAYTGGGFTLNVADDGISALTGGVVLHIPYEVVQHFPTGNSFWHYQIFLTTAGPTGSRFTSRLGLATVIA